jgi:hypothetical protein
MYLSISVLVNWGAIFKRVAHFVEEVLLLDFFFHL